MAVGAAGAVAGIGAATGIGTAMGAGAGAGAGAAAAAIGAATAAAPSGLGADHASTRAESSGGRAADSLGGSSGMISSSPHFGQATREPALAPATFRDDWQRVQRKRIRSFMKPTRVSIGSNGNDWSGAILDDNRTAWRILAGAARGVDGPPAASSRLTGPRLTSQ